MQFESMRAGRTAKLEMARSSKHDAANQLALDREGQADEALIAAVAAAQEKEARDRNSPWMKLKFNSVTRTPIPLEALLDNARQATKAGQADELQSDRDSRNRLRSSLDLRGEQGLQTAYDEAANQLSHFDTRV